MGPSERVQRTPPIFHAKGRMRRSGWLKKECVMSLKQKILVAVMGAGLTLCGVASASASPWQNAHPRRVEVNHRLAHQDMRINRNLREGRITPHQAANLHREDRMMRHEERRD